MYLVDTNVVSELGKPRPEPKVIEFFDNADNGALYLSVVTIGEIRFGIVSIDDPLKRERRAAWLDRTVRPMFVGRILEIGEDEVLCWRLMLDAGKKVGRSFSQPDLFIAASASVRRMILVTRNIRDFVPTGIPVLDPWTGQRFNGA